MKIKFIKKNEFCFKTDKLPLNHYLGEFNGEHFSLLGDLNNNILLTSTSDPCYIKQFDITPFFKTIVFPQVLLEGKISKWKYAKDYMKIIPKYAKSFINDLGLNVVGCNNNSVYTNIIMATLVDLPEGKTVHLGRVSLMNTVDNKYKFAGVDTATLTIDLVQAIMDFVNGGPYDPKKELEETQKDIKEEN